MDPQQAQYVQVTVQTWQAILGIIAVVFATGVAWGTVAALIKSIGKRLDKLEDGFNEYLRARALSAASGDGEGRSPMVPTEVGKKLLAESGAQGLIGDSAFKADVFERVSRSMPAGGYDVEQAVFNALIETKDDAKWGTIKSFIFNHPTYTGSPLTIERVALVMSWVLRDEYRTKHKITN